jgi:hypothetical protein
MHMGEARRLSTPADPKRFPEAVGSHRHRWGKLAEGGTEMVAKESPPVFRPQSVTG